MSKCTSTHCVVLELFMVALPLRAGAPLTGLTSHAVPRTDSSAWSDRLVVARIPGCGRVRRGPWCAGPRRFRTGRQRPSSSHHRRVAGSSRSHGVGAALASPARARPGTRGNADVPCGGPRFHRVRGAWAVDAGRGGARGPGDGGCGVPRRLLRPRPHAVRVRGADSDRDDAGAGVAADPSVPYGPWRRGQGAGGVGREPAGQLRARARRETTARTTRCPSYDRSMA